MASKNPFEDIETLLADPAPAGKQARPPFLTISPSPSPTPNPTPVSRTPSFSRSLSMDHEEKEKESATALALADKEKEKKERRNFLGALSEGDFEDLKGYFEKSEKWQTYAPTTGGTCLTGILSVLPDTEAVNLKVLQYLIEKNPQLLKGENGNRLSTFLDSDHEHLNKIKNKKALSEWVALKLQEMKREEEPKDIFDAVIAYNPILEKFLNLQQKDPYFNSITILTLKKQVKDLTYNALTYALEFYKPASLKDCQNFGLNITTLIKLNPELLKWRNEANATVLSIAAKEGNPFILKFLLSFEYMRDQISITTNGGYTPLEYAIGSGSLECVQLLVDCNPLLLQRRNAKLESVLDAVENYAPASQKAALRNYLEAKIKEKGINILPFFASEALLKSKERQLKGLQVFKKSLQFELNALNKRTDKKMKQLREIGAALQEEMDELILQKSKVVPSPAQQPAIPVSRPLAPQSSSVYSGLYPRYAYANYSSYGGYSSFSMSNGAAASGAAGSKKQRI